MQVDVGDLGDQSGGGAQDHAGTSRGVGRFVDEDEASRAPVSTIGVEGQRGRGAKDDLADLVHGEMLGGLVSMQSVDVQAITQLADHGWRLLR